jgi:ligand-binding sensor domain-containing protein
LGLFQSEDGRTWQKANGLPAVVSDLLVDPAEPARWLAATPAGLYRSQDRGQSWQPVSPPWTIWDMAFGPSGRLFLGRSNGLAWTDEAGADSISWRSARGMERVYFLSVNPHPTEPQTVWSGAWGNNIGASQDGGESVAPVHNGLETLSGLDLIWHPTPGQVTLATLEGLYRTDDSGQSWFRLPGPLSRQTVYNLLQTEDGSLWAGAADGLWLSQDYGATWDLVETFPRVSVLRLGQLAAPSEADRWLWAGAEAAGLWLSPDRGQTWRLAGLPGRTVYNLLADPLLPDRLVVATDQGIFAATVPAEAFR